MDSAPGQHAGTPGGSVLRKVAETLNHSAGCWLKPLRNPTEFLYTPYPEPLTDLEMMADLEEALRLTLTATHPDH